MGKLILVRHGESKLNNSNIFFGHLDPTLTDLGKKQAHQIKKIISATNYSAIYSSTLKRAAETADIININNKKINLSKDLKELNFGIFEGLTYEEIKNEYPKELNQWEKEWKTYNYNTGESIQELQDRCINFIETLNYKTDNIIIVAHFGVINCILSNYLSKNLDSYWKFSPAYCGITVIEFKNEFPVLKGFNMGDIHETI